MVLFTKELYVPGLVSAAYLPRRVVMVIIFSDIITTINLTSRYALFISGSSKHLALDGNWNRRALLFVKPFNQA